MSSRRPRTGNRARLYRPRMKLRGLSRRARQRLTTRWVYPHVSIAAAPADENLPGLVGYMMTPGMGGSHTVVVTVTRDGLGRTVHQDQAPPPPPPKPAPLPFLPNHVWAAAVAPAGTPMGFQVKGADGEWQSIGAGIHRGITFGSDDDGDAEPALLAGCAEMTVTFNQISPVVLDWAFGDHT